MNRNKNFLPIVAMVILLFSTIACAFTARTHQNEGKNSCPAPPKVLDKEDLIGTWVADYANGNMDKIILREDGTYKQIFSSTVPSLSFESKWQKWWSEKKDYGYLYLHLEGMKRCDDLESICKYPNGGLNPDYDRAIDYCQNTSITMKNEVILIVTGTQYNVPKGIVLRHAKLAGSDWSFFFEFQDQ